MNIIRDKFRNMYFRIYAKHYVLSHGDEALKRFYYSILSLLFYHSIKITIIAFKGRSGLPLKVSID